MLMGITIAMQGFELKLTAVDRIQKLDDPS